MEKKDISLNKISVLVFKKSFIRKYQLYKAKQLLTPIDISDIKLQKTCLEESITNINIQSYSEKAKEYLNKFFDVLKANFKEEDLNLFYRNITFLEINTVEKIEKHRRFKSSTLGVYIADQNIILIIKDLCEPYIYHELFHMASNLYFKNKHNMGFKYIKDNNMIGEALNEGYTQVLTERYFNMGEKENIYNLEKSICLLLEKIIGKESMQSYYLNANLGGLIDELSQYIDEEYISRFIVELDTLSYYHNKNLSRLVIGDLLGGIVVDIIVFLTETYIIKLKKENNPNLIKEASTFINCILDMLEENSFCIDDDVFEYLSNLLEDKKDKKM